jgi:pyruvate carboxylase
VRSKLSEDLDGFTVDDEDLNGYLMYPKVFLDYMGRHRQYGPVRTLPTRTFFYGMQPGDEIAAEIDPGKTLEVRLQAVGETSRRRRGEGVLRTERPAPGDPGAEPRGQGPTAARPKAAEGQPRPCRRADAGRGGLGRGARRARRCGRATCLLTIEAMKMETGLHADREATVKAVHVHAGSQIEAKDLLVELE